MQNADRIFIFELKQLKLDKIERMSERRNLKIFTSSDNYSFYSEVFMKIE